MLWLIPVVLLSFGFGQLFKWSQRQGHSAPVVIATNYLVLASILFTYFWSSDQWQPSAQALQIGAVTGVFFIASMLTMTHALTRIEAGPTLTSFRLAIIVPIFAGALLWGETVSESQLVGIALALASLVLLSWRSGGKARSGGAQLIVLIFVLQGLSMCCLHWVHHADLDPERLHVLMVTAATAGALGLAYIALRRLPIRREALLTGAGIGVFNLAALSVSLTGLAHIQGTIFFPINGCGVVLLDNLFAHYVWKEPLGRSGLFGAALGAASMLLIV